MLDYGKLEMKGTFAFKISFKMAEIYILKLSYIEVESKLLYTLGPHAFACNCTAMSVVLN